MRVNRLLNSKIIEGSAELRKVLGFIRVNLVKIEHRSVNFEDFLNNAPVITNSLSKSGTYLLLQVTGAFPHTRYLGRIIASTPSVSLKVRKPHEVSRRVMRTLPSETSGAHMFYSREVEQALTSINAVHIFIYRDLRVVIVSDAIYLEKMKRWRRMHKHLIDFDSQLKLAVDGLDERFPDANSRLLPHAEWLSSPNTVAIRYEDLAGPSQNKTIARIVEAWRTKSIVKKDADIGLTKLIGAIDETRSHTFRAEGTGKWRMKMNEADAKVFSERLRPSIEAFGFSL